MKPGDVALLVNADGEFWVEVITYFPARATRDEACVRVKYKDNHGRPKSIVVYSKHLITSEAARLLYGQEL